MASTHVAQSAHPDAQVAAGSPMSATAAIPLATAVGAGIGVLHAGRSIVPRLPARCIVAALAIAAGPLNAQTVRDSAGIQIVESSRPALSGARAWRLSPKPFLEIGSRASDVGAVQDSLYELLRVNGIVRLSDGRVAVANDGSLTIRFYDQAGKFVSYAGREGQGPGEFQQLMRMTRKGGDTLVITDNGEVEYFSGDGKFVRRGVHRGAEQSQFHFPEAWFRDGSFIAADYAPTAPPPAGRTLMRVPLLRVSADGAHVDTLGTFPLWEQIFDGRTPFGRSIMFSPTGQLACDGERVYVGFPDRYEISVYSGDGRLERIIRRPWHPAAVGDADKAAYRRHALDSGGENGRPFPPEVRARFEKSLESVVFAEQYPAFSTMTADRAGNLWVRQYDYRAEFRTAGRVRMETPVVATRWDVFDGQGRWLITMTLPARFAPLEIGDDYMAGLSRDDDDVEQVQLYRLVKP